VSQKTALTDPRSMQWHDVEADGDVREDKAWRELMGDDRQADRSVRAIVSAELTRLAGHDVTPGHDELHHYWTKGEGLAKWVHSAHPWTALYHHLVKHVNPEMAKRMASAWFHEVLGFWPGTPHVGAVRLPKAGRSAIAEIVAAELELLRKFNPHEPRDPDGKWSLVGAAKKLAGLAKGKPDAAPDEPGSRFPPPPPRLDPATPHVAELRRHFKDRVSHARTGDDALAATPGKFSYDIQHVGDSNVIKYRGRGRIQGVTGAGTPAALEAYQSTDDYMDVNRLLRGQQRRLDMFGDKEYIDTEFDEQTKAHVNELVGEIDKTMSASRLSEDVVVHRVVENGTELFGSVFATGGALEFTGDREHDLGVVSTLSAWKKSGWRPDLTGMKFTDNGFVSTSAHPEWPTKWASQWQGGSSEPVMLRILVPKGTGAIQMSESGEAELLLERGLSFEVAEDHGVGPGGLRHLDLRVVAKA